MVRYKTHSFRHLHRSPVITGLLFILPLLKENSQIKLLPPVESRPYIDLTIQAMADFGVEVKWKDESTLQIKGNQKYCGKQLEKICPAVRIKQK